MLTPFLPHSQGVLGPGVSGIMSWGIFNLIDPKNPLRPQLSAGSLLHTGIPSCRSLDLAVRTPPENNNLRVLNETSPLHATTPENRAHHQ